MVSCLGRCTVPSSFGIVHNRMSSAPSASELQDFYSHGFASVCQDFELHQDGRGTVAALAALADELVARLYRTHFSNDLAGPSNACVVAVGGYGRSALFPHSDIDLLFLFESAEDARPYQEATAAICRALWDLRLKLGQSTHTLAEVDRLDQANPEFAIALLDCRYLAGDRELFAKLRNSVVPRLVLRERKDLLRTLAALTEARHAKYGDTIFHLEPNIKEAPGALRDYDVSRWLQVISQVQERKSGATPSLDWRNNGPGDCRRAYRFLCAARCFLHFRRGRNDNVATYEAQDDAAATGIGMDQRGAISPEDWMRNYFRHVRAIDRQTNQLLDEVPATASSLSNLYEGWRSRLSDADFAVLSGKLFLRQPSALQDPEALPGPFEFMARHGARLSGEAEGQITRAVVAGRERIEQLRDTWYRMRDILTLPHAAEALRAMHRTGLLDQLFPEFRAIDSLVVRDFYHRYTVDEHTFRTIEAVHRLRDATSEWERPYKELFEAIEQPELLFLALLVHDIGKGTAPGDHVRGSLAAVEEIILRIELNPHEAAALRFLVGNHLEMSMTLQRRDVLDPITIRNLSEKIGVPEYLKMLCLFTYADIRGVNPEALTPWKATMLWHLYVRVSNRLLRGVDDERFHASAATRDSAQIGPVLSYLARAAGEDELAAFLDGFPRRYLASHTPEDIAAHYRMASRLVSGGIELKLERRHHFFELTLLTADRPFLFVTILGTLFAWGMNVLKADAFASHAGIALDTFHFTDLHGTIELNPTEAHRFESSLRDVLSGAADLGGLLQGRKTEKAPGKVNVATEIRFDNDSSTHSTLLELIAQDRPGLLYQVSKVLAENACNIEIALVDTEGPKAIDAFYLTVGGKKLPAELQQTVRDALVRTL
jgi:[protein-PII] uridylyltransferase